MKNSRLIFLITAVVLFLGARVDAALSLEARAAIEEMRTRVNSSLQVADTEAADDKYIPGRELQTVLARYRARVYGSSDSTDTTLAHWRVSVPESRQVSADYQPGAMLEKALVNYRTQRTVFSLVKVMKAKEASAADDHVSDDVAEHSADKKAKLPSAEHLTSRPVTVSSSELLTQSKTALNESVENAPQSSAGSVQSSARTNEASSIESASDNSNDDAEVQKYEFKMPRNYRILVK